jgi:hypothetical protein
LLLGCPPLPGVTVMLPVVRPWLTTRGWTGGCSPRSTWPGPPGCRPATAGREPAHRGSRAAGVVRCLPADGQPGQRVVLHPVAAGRRLRPGTRPAAGSCCGWPARCSRRSGPGPRTSWTPATTRAPSCWPRCTASRDGARNGRDQQIPLATRKNAGTANVRARGCFRPAGTGLRPGGRHGPAAGCGSQARRSQGRGSELAARRAPAGASAGRPPGAR